MTSFKDFFKILMGQKFRQMNFVLLINIIAIAVSVLWTLINGDFNNNTFFQVALSWSFIVMLWAFLRITVTHESIYTRDSYRLVPISDTKFYCINLLTSFIAMAYVAVVEFVIGAATAAINWQEYVDSFNMMRMMYGTRVPDAGMIVESLLSMALVMMVVTILAWTTVSLIHLLTRAGSNFMPYRRSRIINFVLYVVVIYIVLRVVGFMMNLVMNSTDMFGNSSDVWHFVLYIVGFLVVSAIEAVLSVYLMNRWVETVSES
ncbi:hypothetical protein [Companilactobacillus furfuricola]|uniref:hypothetical protein n=1 Tax=Companilactobacillus furfuricola TaxID=1462575 RepID=UPI000F77FBA2|nr:hypothetical protein [Companilactobacillus furfuricola]